MSFYMSIKVAWSTVLKVYWGHVEAFRVGEWSRELLAIQVGYGRAACADLIVHTGNIITFGFKSHS